MKCENCKKHYDRTKYITTVECRRADGVDGPHGLIMVWVGANYIGKKFRILVQESDR